jgi:hypothetical protein
VRSVHKSTLKAALASGVWRGLPGRLKTSLQEIGRSAGGTTRPWTRDHAPEIQAHERAARHAVEGLNGHQMATIR